MATPQQKRAIKEVINRNFTFSDLSPRFNNVDESYGNIYCPFHDNHDTPAAKMYWDEEQELWILHCFGECHRNFTAYDYVDLILCNKYNKYKSPYDFLKENMDLSKLRIQLKTFEKMSFENSRSYFDKKVNYINQTFDEQESITEFIEKLYTK